VLFALALLSGIRYIIGRVNNKEDKRMAFKVIYVQGNLLRAYAEVIVTGRYALNGTVQRLIGAGHTVTRIARIA
jgi:hypothetical protein